MELMLVWRVLRRWWWLVLLPVLVVAALTLPGLLRSGALPPMYSITMRYTVAQTDTNLPDRDGDYQDVWRASELAVNAFTDWVRSDSFKQELVVAAEAAGTPVTQDNLSVSADNAHSIGQLILVHPNRDELLIFGEQAITVLRDRSPAYLPQLGDQPAAVSMLDRPTVVTLPPPVANRLEPLIRLGLALLAGLLLAGLVEYLDPYVRRRDEVEAAGLRVIASVPRGRRQR